MNRLENAEAVISFYLFGNERNLLLMFGILATVIKTKSLRYLSYMMGLLKLWICVLTQ